MERCAGGRTYLKGVVPRESHAVGRERVEGRREGCLGERLRAVGACAAVELRV